MTVEVARDQKLYAQSYSKGKLTSKLSKGTPVKNRRGTTIAFHPDPAIFGKEALFHPARLSRMARSTASLYSSLAIRWTCEKSLLDKVHHTPENEHLPFPHVLPAFLAPPRYKIHT